jgi:hypothetical protein
VAAGRHHPPILRFLKRGVPLILQASVISS